MIKINLRTFSITSFAIVLLGVIAQAFHNYMIAGFLSNFDGTAKTIQAIFLAVFFSLGLLYFGIKAGTVKYIDTVNPEKYVKRYKRIATFFAIFEGFSNVYYWIYKLILFPALGQDYFNPNWQACDWYSAPVAVVFAIAIPVIIRCYAGEILIQVTKDDEKKKHGRPRKQIEKEQMKIPFEDLVNAE
jgi:hypothetical protein